MTTYYKIIGNNFGSFPYKLGLNRLADNNEIFDSSPTCGPGGLYFFCELNYIFRWLYYGNTVCELIIPAGAQVVAVGDKFKSDSIYIEQKLDLDKIETFKYLISKGLDIHIDNDIPLRYASRNGYLDIVKFLVENGANINANNDYALGGASENGYLDIVKFLVENGANINANNDYALGCASRNGYLDIVKFLVENGANVRASDDYALRYASENGHLSIVKLLVKNGANIHARDDHALRYASENGHLPVFRFLVKKGARIHKYINSSVKLLEYPYI